MPDPSFRIFAAGSWDLRKRDRRQRQVVIEFPDRRRTERRGVQTDSEPELTWESKPWLDE